MYIACLKSLYHKLLLYDFQVCTLTSSELGKEDNRLYTVTLLI